MMAEPDPGAAVRREFNCQTPGCPNDYAVISIDVESSEVSFHCRGCWLAFVLAVMQAMADAGLIAAPDGDAGEVATAAPPG